MKTRIYAAPAVKGLTGLVFKRWRFVFPCEAGDRFDSKSFTLHDMLIIITPM